MTDYVAYKEGLLQIVSTTTGFDDIVGVVDLCVRTGSIADFIGVK